MSLLTAEDLTVALGGRRILQQVCFGIERGTWLGLLGPNGSGKTTLLRTVSGRLPYEGTLDLLGRPVRTWRPRELARQVAFVRQSVPLTFELTVHELVLLGRNPHKRWLEGHDERDYERVRDALALAELGGLESRSVLTLSGGELQRAFLAQALVQEADLLLLDEPTSHLDVHFQYGLMDRVRALVDAGRTVVSVFHDLELAARYADRLVILSDGRVVATGTPECTLTEQLIAEVFRMRAACGTDGAGRFRIRYDEPLTVAPYPPHAG